MKGQKYSWIWYQQGFCPVVEIYQSFKDEAVLSHNPCWVIFLLMQWAVSHPSTSLISKSSLNPHSCFVNKPDKPIASPCCVSVKLFICSAIMLYLGCIEVCLHFPTKSHTKGGTPRLGTKLDICVKQQDKWVEVLRTGAQDTGENRTWGWDGKCAGPG